MFIFDAVRYLLTTLLLLCCMSIAKAQLSAGAMPAPGSVAPWKPAELMEAGELNYTINEKKAPVIFNIGSVEDIKGAIHI